MYELLLDFIQRPAPHSRFTAKDLWTRPHLARRMLQFHLDRGTELASRPFAAIDAIVEWLDRKIPLEGRSLCDLGCGPGLYATRFAERGAEVTGIDFSRHSLDYAMAEGDCIGMQRTILYPDESLSLDHTLSVEPTGSWQIFNWFQYFAPERLSDELSEAGFRIDTLAGSLAGAPLTDASAFMGIIATNPPPG